MISNINGIWSQVKACAYLSFMAQEQWPVQAQAVSLESFCCGSEKMDVKIDGALKVMHQVETREGLQHKNDSSFLFIIKSQLFSVYLCGRVHISCVHSFKF